MNTIDLRSLDITKNRYRYMCTYTRHFCAAWRDWMYYCSTIWILIYSASWRNIKQIKLNFIYFRLDVLAFRPILDGGSQFEILWNFHKTITFCLKSLLSYTFKHRRLAYKMRDSNISSTYKTKPAQFECSIPNIHHFL